jgi:hypothetical protein
MSEPSLWDRFPDMRPIRRVPPLFRVNGIGLAALGARDRDADTGTYVKTLWLTVLFLPVLPLAAYRVADAEGGGWYFLGRVPLSGLARGGFLLALALVAGGVGLGAWHWYTDTQEYRAARRLAEADRLLAAGQAGKAAAVYAELARGPEQTAAPARERLSGLLDSPPPGADAVAVFQTAADLDRGGRPVLGDVVARARRHAGAIAGDDPDTALAVLDAVAPLAPRDESLQDDRRKLLERLVARDPNDPAPASRLAVLYDVRGDRERCEKLLAPHAGRLGALDGAAFLGRIWAAKGKREPAIQLLDGYVSVRLPRLHAAERAYADAAKNAQERALGQFRQAVPPDFDAADRAERVAMLNTYLGSALKADPDVLRAEDALRAEAPVVSAALELGTLLLEQAQVEKDPAARRADLKKAEETFVAIHGLAGDSDAYRLHLGQVYFWLGKPGEGRAQFDKLLAAHGRATEPLLRVANALREVGAVTDARALAEEAYQKGKDAAQKEAAAHVRALMATDLDDRITWLGRSKADDPSVQAELHTARGQKALDEGNDGEAEAELSQAAAVYGRMPENAATLNNSALVFFALYRIHPERKYLQAAADRLDRAVALEPGDSILLRNAAGAALQQAYLDVLGPTADWTLLGRPPGTEGFAFLYRDEASRQKLTARLAAHPGVQRARGLLEKLLLLAPKSPNAYEALSALHGLTRDADALRTLAGRLRGADLDLAQETKDTLDSYTGKDDAKDLVRLKGALARAERVLPPARKAGGTTFALAAGGVVSARLSLAALRQEVDADALVRLAEEAHAAAPSAGTSSTLRSALRWRAHRDLCRADRGYAALAERTRRSLGSGLVVWVLGHEGAPRERALALPDVRRLVELELEQDRAFPDTPSLYSWATLRGARPADAARVGKAILADPLTAADLEVDRALAPLSADVVLRTYWLDLLTGKEAEAKEALRQAAARGVPLPTGAATDGGKKGK